MDVLGLPRQAVLVLLAIALASSVPWLLPTATSPHAVATATLAGALVVALAGGLLGRLAGTLTGFATAVSLVRVGHVPDGVDGPLLVGLLAGVGVLTGTLAGTRRRWRDEALAAHSRLRRVRRIAESGGSGNPRDVVIQARWELGDELAVTSVGFAGGTPSGDTVVLDDDDGPGSLARRRGADDGLELPGRLAVAVRSHGELAGYLVIASAKGTAISRSQLAFLRTVAAQVGTAVAMSPPWRRPDSGDIARMARMVVGRSQLDDTTA